MIAIITRRNGCSRDEAEEFGSWARLRVLEDGCRRIRRFTGASSFSTYVTVVLQNLFLDFRTAKWGKWRPSARARRLGDVAVRLETLVHRDGLEPLQAFEQMRAEGLVESLDEVEALLVQCPRRPRPVTVSTDRIEELPLAGQPEAPERLTHQVHADRVGATLNAALADLDDEDRYLLRLHYVEGVSLVDIAPTLSVEARDLYPRLRRLKRALRSAMASAGVTAEQVTELLEWSELDLSLDLGSAEPGDEAAEATLSGDAPSGDTPSIEPSTAGRAPSSETNP